jgi:hypothetical protein
MRFINWENEPYSKEREGRIGSIHEGMDQNMESTEKSWSINWGNEPYPRSEKG